MKTYEQRVTQGISAVPVNPSFNKESEWQLVAVVHVQFSFYFYWQREVAS